MSPEPVGPGQVRRPRRLPAVATAASSVAVAGWGFARVLGPGDVLLPVLLGAFGPAALLAVLVAGWHRAGRGRRLPVAVSLPVSLLTGLVGGPLLVSAVADGPGPLGSLRAFGGTWRTLLTTTLPARPDAPTLLAVLLLLWVASVLAVEAALRASAAVTALVPSGVVLVVAVAYGLPAGGDGALRTAGALALAGAVHVAVVRALPAPGGGTAVVPPAPDRATAVLRAAAVLLVAVLAAAAGSVLGPRLPYAEARQPFDPRVLVDPPQESSSGVSALARVSQWLAGPVQPLLAVEGELSDENTLRLVSLDRYDGTAWTADETYVVAGRRLPAGPDLPGRTRPVTVDVAVGALPGRWLPAPDRARSVDGFVAKVSPDSGALVTAGQPLAGARYTVRSDVRTADPAAVVTAGASGPDLAAQRTLPDERPQVLAETARTAAGAGASPVERLLRLEQWMQQNLRYDPGALPGHSLGVLERFVQPGAAGTMEQFAAAYAVMARELGYPSRVTVGFTAGTAVADPVRTAQVDTGTAQPGIDLGDDPVLNDPASMLGPEARTVTTRDAMAWPEVWLQGAGWLRFYPVPQVGEAQQQDVISGVGAPPDRVDLEDVTGTAPQEQPDEQARARAADGPSAGQQVLVGAVTLLLLLVAWVLVAGVWRAVRRHRNRTHGPAARRVLAAWQEVLRALASAGLPGVRAMTSDEVVQHGWHLVEPQHRTALVSVAAGARSALFSGRPVPEEDAASAWRDADAVTRAVRRRRGARGRLGDLLRPPRS